MSFWVMMTSVESKTFMVRSFYSYLFFHFSNSPWRSENENAIITFQQAPGLARVLLAVAATATVSIPLLFFSFLFLFFLLFSTFFSSMLFFPVLFLPFLSHRFRFLPFTAFYWLSSIFLQFSSLFSFRFLSWSFRFIPFILPSVYHVCSTGLFNFLWR